MTLVIQRSADGSSGWADIAGTTDVASYVVASGDNGFYLRVKETIGGVVAYSSVIGPITGGGGRSWPASFKTGPLGNNNILPTSASGAFLCAMFGGVGFNPSAQRAQIASRQSALGRHYDVIQHQYDGGAGQSFGGAQYAEDPTNSANTIGGISQEQFALNNGSYIALAWSPNITIADINNGLADAACQKYGTYWATYAPNPVMLRLMWEFDLNGFPWSIYGVNGNMANPPLYDAAHFILAWKRIVDNIRIGNGTANNVGFWWCPFEGGGQGGQAGRQKQADYYPGDNYVDWVGTDVYTGPFQSSILTTGRADWWQNFNYSVSGSGQTTLWSAYDMFSSGLAATGSRGFTGPQRIKPFMVGETSATYVAGSPSAKATYFTNVVNLPNSIGAMPNCIGISWYDREVHAPTDYDWRVGSDASAVNVVGNDPDATTLAGFVSMATNAKLVGR